jgi:hypothetical protein
MTSTSRQAARLAGSELRGACHACALFVGLEEEYRVLLPFVREGVESGERCFHIVDPDRQQERLEHLGRAGIDLDRTVASGQVEVRTWEEAYLSGGRFDQHAMLALIEETLRGGRDGGFGRTRLWADMEWALQDLPGSGDFIEYESRLNPVLAQGDDVVVCTYELNQRSAPFVMDILRTHPMVIIGDTAQENPFYVPTDRFLDDLAKRRKTPARADAAGG